MQLDFRNACLEARQKVPRLHGLLQVDALQDALDNSTPRSTLLRTSCSGATSESTNLFRGQMFAPVFAISHTVFALFRPGVACAARAVLTRSFDTRSKASIDVT